MSRPVVSRRKAHNVKRSPLAWILVLVVLVVGGVGAAIGTSSNQLPPVAVPPAAPGLPATPDGAAVGASPGATPSPSALATTGPATASGAASVAMLATLPVKGRAPKTGYDRVGDFGTAWKDVDHNGCDTRNDILARDLTSLVLSGPCKVLSGKLADPYTGTTINFVRGNTTSTLVQIDHLVALSDAWQTGAQQLTQDRRVSLANDPLNLMAVDGPTNSSKGDGDTATWLPPNKGIRCAYVERQILVKVKYDLWVTPAEHDAMLRVLGAC